MKNNQDGRVVPWDKRRYIIIYKKKQCPEADDRGGKAVRVIQQLVGGQWRVYGNRYTSEHADNNNLDTNYISVAIAKYDIIITVIYCESIVNPC